MHKGGARKAYLLLSLRMTAACMREKKNIKQLLNTVPSLAVTNKVGFGNNVLVKSILRHLNSYIIFLCKKIKYASKQHSQVQVFRSVCTILYIYIHHCTPRAAFVILLASSTSLPSASTPSKT